MSIVVTVYVPSGIVMAADSRIIATQREERREKGTTLITERQIVVSDNAYKVIDFTRVPVGAATFGTGIIQDQSVDSHIRAFEEEATTKKDTVETIPGKLLNYFQKRFPDVEVGFFTAGFSREDEISVPHVYALNTGAEPGLRRINVDDKGKLQYGVLRGGDTLTVDRLINPQYLPPFAAMPLQDAIDYATYLIRTTIETLRFEPRFPTCGGPIDVLVITPHEMYFVQKKELKAG